MGVEEICHRALPGRHVTYHSQFCLVPGGSPGCRHWAGPLMDSHEKDDFDLQGRIGCFSLSDLLQTLSFTQKTGTLTLIQGWNTRTICYEQGRITYIAAATRLPNVVDLLLQAGRLTARQLEETVGPEWRQLLNLRDEEHALP